jgi:hypothetical protein
MPAIADPRLFPEQADASQTAVYVRIASSLAGSAVARANAIDEAITAEFAKRLEEGDAAFLTALLEAAPSAAIARYLWRRMIEAWDVAGQPAGDARIAATLFALPVVIVAAAQTGPETRSSFGACVPGVLTDAPRIAAILREHGALGGCQTFALAGALCRSDQLDHARLPALLRWQKDALEAAAAVREVTPSPIALVAPDESVHLRFMVGTALAAPRAAVLAATDATGWGIPLARELARQLATANVSVLALPRSPAAPLTALQQGRVARRTVGAQLFASNAIRRLRASVGEPSAVISAHRCPEAPGGGELRLSLSSAFDPRQAEGFRCPLYPTDNIDDVVTMLLELLRDCRVHDLRVLAGVHTDRDPRTGAPLLFKGDALPAGAPSSLH